MATPLTASAPTSSSSSWPGAAERRAAAAIRAAAATERRAKGEVKAVTVAKKKDDSDENGGERMLLRDEKQYTFGDMTLRIAEGNYCDELGTCSATTRCCIVDVCIARIINDDVCCN